MHLQIIPMQSDDVPTSINLFIQELDELMAQVPELQLKSPNRALLLSDFNALLATTQALVALRDGEIVGYLGWNIFERFRGLSRRTAYSPEWAHAAPGAHKFVIYKELYTAASQIWFNLACQSFVLTLLANDTRHNSFWYENGFGLLVVDAVRTISTIGDNISANSSIRKAALADLELIENLDQEHWQYYSQPPTLMVPHAPRSKEQLAAIISCSQSSIWTATCGNLLCGMMSFEAESEGATMLVNPDTNIAISSAYVRPTFRRRNLAVAILQAALQYYSRLGFQTCSVNFESVNPLAAAFWLKYFRPVCHSVMRVPEYHQSVLPE